MPETDLIVGEAFGDNDIDPEDPSPCQFDEGNGEWSDADEQSSAQDSGE